MKKILFYTDCRFFAGCENMLIQLDNSVEIKKIYKTYFYYRYSKFYLKGLKNRTTSYKNWIPLYFFDFSNPDFLSLQIPIKIRRFIMFIIRRFFNIFLITYEIFIFRRLFKKMRPDIIHINCGGFPPSLSQRACVISGALFSDAKIIAVINNVPNGYKKFSRKLDFFNDKIFFYLVDKFITGSKYNQKNLYTMSKLKMSSIKSIVNGVAIRDFDETYFEKNKYKKKYNDEIYFGVVGLLIPRKGHEIIINAVKILKDSEPKIYNRIKIFIDGEGDDLDKLKNKIEILELNDKFIFVGLTKKIFSFLNFIDVLIFSSIADEDFPNINLEAMSLSKPIIASKIAGVEEQVIHHTNGLLYEKGDSNGIAKNIKYLFENQDLIMKFGKSGKKIYENKFSPKPTIARYLDFYQNL